MDNTNLSSTNRPTPQRRRRRRHRRIASHALPRRGYLNTTPFPRVLFARLTDANQLPVPLSCDMLEGRNIFAASHRIASHRARACVSAAKRKLNKLPPACCCCCCCALWRHPSGYQCVPSVRPLSGTSGGVHGARGWGEGEGEGPSEEGGPSGDKARRDAGAARRRRRALPWSSSVREGASLPGAMDEGGRAEWMEHRRRYRRRRRSGFYE